MSIIGVKYCDTNTLSEVPKYANLRWPSDEDSEDESSEEGEWEDDEGAEEGGDEDEEIEVVEEAEVEKAKDMPGIGQIMGDFCDRTSDLCFPVSEDGRIICEYIEEEIEKRDQDSRGMYIYNDWNGWGMREVWENLIRRFNRDIFTKTITPYKKYAYIEGVAAFVKTEDLAQWIGHEDGDSCQSCC